MESSYSQCSPCWSDEQPSPPQLFCRRSPADLALPRGNSLSHAPLHASNNSALHGHQRRGVRLKVKGKKSTLRMYARQNHRRQHVGVIVVHTGVIIIIRVVFIRHSAGGKNSQNRKVTDYYPIRRSSRKSKTELKVR